MKGLVGSFIDERRAELKLSKTDLAKRIGISRQSLHKLISGDIETTSIITLTRLSAVLNLHPMCLMEQVIGAKGFSPYPTRGAAVPGDGTSFIGDLTYPDNSIVQMGERFTKMWRSRNTGDVPWEGRFMKCLDEGVQLVSSFNDHQLKDFNRGLIPHSRLIEVPTVAVGEYVDIQIDFMAPNYPCKAISYWKMVDAEGNVCFPKSEGLSCLVQVI